MYPCFSKRTIATLALCWAAGAPAVADAKPLSVRAEVLTEGAAIPFTRLTGSEVNPGALVGLEWFYLDRSAFTVFQTGYGLGFSHGSVERGILLGTELGMRGSTDFGLAAECSFGAGYLHAFSGSSSYAKNESGRYVVVPDRGRPRFSPTLHAGVGYDLSRQRDLPVAMFLQYGTFMEIPYSTTQFPVLPHVTLGVSVRVTLGRSAS